MLSYQVASGTEFNDIEFDRAFYSGLASSLGAGSGAIVDKVGKAYNMGRITTSTTSSFTSSVVSTKASGQDVTVEGTLLNMAGGKLGEKLAKRLGNAVPVSTSGIPKAKPTGSPNSRKHNRSVRRQTNKRVSTVQAERAVGNGIAGQILVEKQ